MVANEGYAPGRVNFSCRVARCARARGEGVDIIASLRGYASLTLDQDGQGEGEGRKTPLIERVGDDFARGHVQASGGIVSVEDFEELMLLMRVGEKKKEGEGEKKDGGSPAKKKKAGIDPGQKNTLTGYFAKAAQKS